MDNFRQSQTAARSAALAVPAILTPPAAGAKPIGSAPRGVNYVVTTIPAGEVYQLPVAGNFFLLRSVASANDLLPSSSYLAAVLRLRPDSGVEIPVDLNTPLGLDYTALTLRNTSQSSPVTVGFYCGFGRVDHRTALDLPSAASAHVDWQRPNNTTAYGALACIGTFDPVSNTDPGVAYFALSFGSDWADAEVFITDFVLEIDIAALPTGMSSGFNVELWSDNPGLSDGDTFNISSADRPFHLRSLSGLFVADKGDTLKGSITAANTRVKLNANGDLLFTLVTVAGYTPAALTVHRATAYISRA